jgi:prepilin-type N-terminal cleavage/methylation domain-containing protein
VTERPPAAAFAGPRARGFTFLELLVVMGIMAVLAGLGVGFLKAVGRTSRIVQAREILRETAFACKHSSNGGTRAIFDLHERVRDGKKVLVVGAATARTVLTHQFETLDAASNDYPLKPVGKVEIVSHGYVGHAAHFVSGSYLDFEPQSAFAMTEGIEIDVWLKPEGANSAMTVLEGEGAYRLQLRRDKAGKGYDVVLSLWLKSPELAGDDVRSPGVKTDFATEDGPVRADGVWTHVQARYDGVDPSIRVDDIERLPRKPRPKVAVLGKDEIPAGSPPTRRLVVPEGGVVHLTVSAPTSGFVGSMDMLNLGGVFRSSDVEREISGLILERPRLPVRVVFQNGRLDPLEHPEDVLLVFREEANPNGPRLELRLGRFGTVEALLAAPGAGKTP